MSNELQKKDTLQSLTREFSDMVRLMDGIEECEVSGDREVEKAHMITELNALIAGKKGEIAKKIHGIKRFFEYLDDREKRLREYKANADAAIHAIDYQKNELTEYVLHALKEHEDATGEKSIECDGAKLSYQKAGKSPLIIDDESEIDDNYASTRFVVRTIAKSEIEMIKSFFSANSIAYNEIRYIDKDAVRNALTRGDEVSGAHLGEQTEIIKIKVR